MSDLSDNNQQGEFRDIELDEPSDSEQQKINQDEEKNIKEEENIEQQQYYNEYLDQLSKDLMNDYAKYFHLQPDAQIEDLNECIENLLTHMEEFYGLIERIRNHSNQCLDQLTTQLIPKLKECQKLFALIDKLERIVNHVSLQVSLMEREVSRAEKMMGTKTSTVKKLLSFINPTSSSSSQESSRYQFVPPDIFKTEELMKM